MFKIRILAGISMALISLTSAVSLSAQDSKTVPGKTIFGESKKETTKAMKQIVKDLGLKKECAECHVKGDFAKDTPKKEIARQMKLGFVDSLVEKGKTQFELVEDGKTILVMAQLKSEGKDAGIHLSATTPDKKTHSKVVPLPKKGDAITCATCHNGAKHITLVDH